MAASSSSFLASPGLCRRSFLGFTEHWTELESENEPPRKRKRLSLRRKEITEPDLLTIDGERRVGAPSGSLSFRGCERRFLLSAGSLRSPYLS